MHSKCEKFGKVIAETERTDFINSEQKERRLFALEVGLVKLLATRFLVHFFFVCFHFFLCVKGLATALVFFFLRLTHLTISPTEMILVVAVLLIINEA